GGGGGVLCPMLDARKEEVFAAVYRMESPFVLEKLTADMALRPRKLLEDLPRFGEMQHSLGHTDAKVTFLGDGAERYRVLIEETLGSSAVFVPPHRSYPRAATIAFMGLAALKEGNVNDITTVTPRYVRPSDAERHYRGVT
ncbi:MAG: hypothetical protein JXD19_09900, partial [Deltaproteobacteria bacterium]|nr:hypothetical protein [Deltaproteobacteria bacterium]